MGAQLIFWMMKTCAARTFDNMSERMIGEQGHFLTITVGKKCKSLGWVGIDDQMFLVFLENLAMRPERVMTRGRKHYYNIQIYPIFNLI